MHWRSTFVLLLGAVAGTHAQLEDLAVDSVRPPPPRCGINEHFESNSNSCQITCDNMRYEAVMGACVPTSDCYCNKGYVRNEEGTCIKREDCPPPRCPNGEIWNDCGSACPATCANRGNTCLVCTQQCVRGCFCAGGTVRAPDGSCVKPENCPPRTCSGPNEVFVKCPSTCPRTEKCENLWSKKPCTPIDCCEPKCRCKPGYYRNDKNVCVSAKQCTKPNQCGPNEVSTDCYNDCQKTCKNRFDRNPKVCPLVCNRTGCICKEDYIRHDNGTCVPEYQCSPPECGEGEVYSDCNSSCSELCEDIGNTCLACVAMCIPGCYCANNTFRAPDGSCVKAKNCPPRICGRNEVFVNCPPTCPRTEECKNLWSKEPCTPIDCCHPSCRCKPGYFRNEQNACVSARECNLQDASCNGDSNAVIKVNPIPCPSTCNSPNASPWCKRYAPPVGCECKPGYLQVEDGGKCIQPEECPGGNPCGVNGTFVWCRAGCPTDYCPVDDSRAIIACDPPYPCPNGCVCKLNYRRKSESDDTCILASTCPPVKCTRPNEIWDPCPSACHRERCPDIKNQPTTCNTLVLNCQPQCVCKKGYFRNDTDICIPGKDCPINKPCDDPNAERLECAPAPSCRSTCAVPNPSPCILSCAVNECVCKKGYVLSAKDGKCIPVEQCPNDVPCNGDSNAVIKANPIPCPSTCNSPNASPWCKRYAPPVGCECKPGYLQVEDGGKCIKPEECPGGNPCGANGTFVWCKVGCPTDYCPVDDRRAIIACSPPYPCPNGCVCKINYRRKSASEDTCILASTCPPVKCTRLNEIWDPCPSACRRERCPDITNQPTTCNTLILNCQPQCVCKKGYFRNDTDICIPGKDCPNQICSDANAERVQCAPAVQCRPTCAVRHPGPCIEICVIDDCVCKKGFILSEKGGKCIPEDQCPANNQCSDPNAERVECALPTECRPSCAVPIPNPCISQICIKNECICKKGYVLSEKGGKCVTVDQCPIQKSCNGDPNAQIKECPLACPATCDVPNAIPCRKACVPIGCECKDGYILSESNGKCILPEKCKGGYPCGRNETFVSCKVPCPSDNCPVGNSPNTVICETPNPCYPGCVCKFNYRRKSVDDRRCIYASECPPQTCPKNEVWSPCPSECLQEDCSDVNQPPVVCNTLLLNCQPKCICKKGYYRDSNRNCVLASQCPKPIQCKDNEVFHTCRIICPPQTCASIYRDYDCRGANTRCEPGCDCISDYLRNGTENDPCIPSSQCPTTPPVIPECGINEHYETNRNKCELTCKNYELESIIGPCQATSGCFCDTGYVKNSNGLCIPKKQCPKNIVCPPNEVVSECYNSCHKTCKTRLRSDGRMCQLACIQTGCLCKEGYLRHDNGTCVPISECSPPRCDENETYSSCGTACPPTCQNRGDNCTACTDQCVADCFCNKGLVRAEDGTCVRPKDCPKRTCNDPNELFDECPPTCPPTDGCSNIWSKFNCTNAIKCCEPKCRCRPGYYRKDICVPVNQCLS